MGRYRNEVLKVMLTKKEKEALLKKIKLAGMTNMSEFVRAALTSVTVVNLDTNGLKEFTYQIERLGINVNQIAKHANTTGNLYKNEIEDIRNSMASLRRLPDEIYTAIKKTGTGKTKGGK